MLRPAKVVKACLWSACALTIGAYLLTACSETSVTDAGPSGTTTSTGATAPATVALTVTPSSGLSVRGTATVSATVKDSAGANVANGTVVTFSVSATALGSITPTATTVSGVATATFTAGSVAGTATITAKAGSITQTTTIAIAGASAASIQFVSASPAVIGVKGSGQTENSVITFSVSDGNAQPVTDGTTVSFSLNGPKGGETLSVSTASTVGGAARTTLQSGSVPGPVTITASVTVGSQTLSSSSTPISIGGGIPSATHFNLSATQLNLAGLVASNKQSTISAFIADRFGNFNVLTGTSISFYTEAGAIDRSNVTGSSGSTSVTFRTQAPDPADVVSGTSPQDGWVTVLATVQGEEAFSDTNANGRYDTGEPFIDLPEPFIDKNDNGVRDTSPVFEEYIDANGNGRYDGVNGVWDGPGCAGSGCQSVKTIFTDITLAFTGNAQTCSITPSTYTISAGGSQAFLFSVGDVNTNRLVPGTTIAVTATKGTLAGQTSYTIPDGIGGPATIAFTLADPDTDATVDASLITVTVTSTEVIGCTATASGSVQ